jgi:hypothetical protein
MVLGCCFSVILFDSFTFFLGFPFFLGYLLLVLFGVSVAVDASSQAIGALLAIRSIA